MKPKLIIFDKDGTLIDNVSLFMPSIIEMIRKIETKVEDKNKFYKFIGFNNSTGLLSVNSFIFSNSLKNSVSKISKKFNIPDDTILKSFGKMKINKNTVIPYVNLQDLFSFLKRENIMIAMNTSDTRKNTLKCNKILDINRYLDMVVCGDDGLKNKPAPDTIRYICNSLDVSPFETWMVGDTQADIDAGLKAKCSGVFLVRQDGNFDRFKNYHVHIRDVNQLNYYL